MSAVSKMTAVIFPQLVGSAPQYPQGIIDPIEQIAALGDEYEIPVHVDCCLGGFIMPFMDAAGFPVQPFDFRLAGQWG